MPVALAVLAWDTEFHRSTANHEESGRDLVTSRTDSAERSIRSGSGVCRTRRRDFNVQSILDRPNPVTDFFEQLFAEGRPRLMTDKPPDANDIAAVTRSLLEFEREYRQTLPGNPPIPAPKAVAWGARLFYRAAQFLVFRALGPEQLEQDLSVPCREAICPAVCYGVDLTFRFLPDLTRLARAASPGDPLVKRLTSWAAEWPLSSVSVPDVTVNSIEGFIADRSLRMLYVDRILAARDTNRLSDPRVREAVRGALGAFPESSPEVAAALRRESSDSA